MSDTRHAHEWVRVEDAEGIRAWACTDCDETSATCGTCHRASGSSLLLCASCERQAARVLDDIADALGYYETPPRSLINSPGDMRLVPGFGAVSYTHLRAHETRHDIVCSLLLEK